MKKLIFFAMLLGACATPQKAVPPTLTLPQPGWNRIAGDEATKCATGTPYAFFVRAGDPDKLMIYFQGGGACWSAMTCALGGRQPFYKPFVAGDEQPYRGGILDLERADNPVRGYTAVFVPYCTGDVHIGNRSATYTTSSGPLEIRHNGGGNALAAISWTYDHVAAPSTILVTGESAGSIPTPFYAVQIARRYPKARVVQLGDASGAYRVAQPFFDLWGATGFVRDERAFRELDSAAVTFNDLYTLAARADRKLVLAQINSAEDTTQAFFLRAVGVTTPVSQMLASNHAYIRAAAPGFRAFTVPGPLHAIIPRPEFYSASVDGVRLRDWVDQLLKGESVKDVAPR